jgi:hypothetical protein
MLSQNVVQRQTDDQAFTWSSPVVILKANGLKLDIYDTVIKETIY